MRQETKGDFRVKILKAQAVGRSAVGAHEQRQEMLHDLDGQITKVFLVAHAKAGIARGHQAGQALTADADVHAVVGQTEVGRVWHHHEVVDDDAGIAQLLHAVELAARDHLMTQPHVRALFFPAIPTGKAGVHEQLAVESI